MVKFHFHSSILKTKYEKIPGGNFIALHKKKMLIEIAFKQ